MRKKPREEWHRYEPLNEKRLGRIEAAISLNAEVAKTFLRFLQLRIKRGTGLRFKIAGEGAIETVRKGDKKYTAVELFDKHPYIFPEKSPHTNRYDSEWNRIEIYIPIKEEE